MTLRELFTEFTEKNNYFHEWLLNLEWWVPLVFIAGCFFLWRTITDNHDNSNCEY